MPEKPFTSSPNSPRRFCSAKGCPRADAAPSQRDPDAGGKGTAKLVTPGPATTESTAPGPTASESAASESCQPGTKQRGPLLICPADLPGVSLAVAHVHPPAQPRHVHDSLILGVVTAGARRIRTSHGETRIGTGEVFALPPGLAHACEPAEEHAAEATGKHACAYFAFSIQAASLPPLVLAALPARIADGALARTLERLAEAVQQECGSLERQSLLAEALERLARHAWSVGPGSGEGIVEGLEPGSGPNIGAGSDEHGWQAQPQDVAKGLLLEAARRAKELLESEDGAQCSLPELAQACGVDMYALHRAFTSAVGLPPHAYQAHLRLRRAKALLRAGSSPSEAALEAGFCDQSHLNRHFARLVGLTPAQYARAHKGRGRAARPGRKALPR